MSGKDSGRRPAQVDADTFQSNWDGIFSGRGVTVSTSGSNPLSSGSNPDAPAKRFNKEWAEWLVANLYEMDTSKIPPQPPFYIDDATGIQVSEDWWPGDEHDTP